MSITGIGQADVFGFRSHFDNAGSSLDFQVFNDRDGIAIRKNVAMGIADKVVRLSLWCGVCAGQCAPLVRALRAHPKVGILVNIFRIALGTVCRILHTFVLAPP